MIQLFLQAFWGRRTRPQNNLFRLLSGLLCLLILGACAEGPASPTPTPALSLPASPTATASAQPASTLAASMHAANTPAASTPAASPTPTPPSDPKTNWTATPTASATPQPLVPAFSHIGVIVLENREFGSVIGNPQMPQYNEWAAQYTLLTEHYAIQHPSLPNYLALIGGDTFGIQSNCTDCFIAAPSLPDLLEASGRSWKTYQEDMPAPCFLGDSLTYYQKHNPFIYFDPIRLDASRCQQGIVPLAEIHTDLKNQTLPDFFFITPNICNSAHDCTLNLTEIWLGNLVPYLLAYPEMQRSGLLIITWDEGQGDHGCCGIEPGGGRVATLLLSPLAQKGLQDATPYTHYSLLKTIAEAWSLPLLGHAADPSTSLITLPWIK